MGPDLSDGRNKRNGRVRQKKKREMTLSEESERACLEGDNESVEECERTKEGERDQYGGIGTDLSEEGTHNCLKSVNEPA